jgi:hypothetical protein
MTQIQIKHWSLKALALGAFLIVASAVAPPAEARDRWGVSISSDGGYGISYSNGRHHRGGYYGGYYGAGYRGGYRDYRPYYRDYGYYAPGYYYNRPYSYYNVAPAYDFYYYDAPRYRHGHRGHRGYRNAYYRRGYHRW